MKAPEIYLIDDDDDDRILLRQAIEKVIPAVSVFEFESAFEFSNLIPSCSVNAACLVLLDINMPKMDGVELLRVLRSNPIYAWTPVLIISTTINQLIVGETNRLGIEDYLAKPSSPQGLIQIAETIRDCYKKTYAAR